MTMTVGKRDVYGQLAGWALPDDLNVDSARPVVVRGPAEPEALPPSGGVAEPARDGWAAIAKAHHAAAETAAAGQAGQALLNGTTAASGLAEPGLPHAAPGTLQIEDLYVGLVRSTSDPHTPAGFVAKAETVEMARRDEGIAKAAANIGAGRHNTAAAKDAGTAAAADASTRGDGATALGAAGAVLVPILTAPALSANATAGVSATAAVAAAPAGVGGVGAAAQTLANEFGDDLGDDLGAQVTRVSRHDARRAAAFQTGR